MINQQCYQLGAEPSVIRALFAYGLQQAAIVGPENVYDYSLGNPSIPAPAAVNASILDIVSHTDSIKIHGYTMAAGLGDTRAAVAADLEQRFGLPVKAEELFFTCGAAPALLSVIRALTVEDAEILAIAPFFPEYRPFVEGCGAAFRMVPADTETFQISLEALEAQLTPHTQAIIVNSPNNPSGVVYTRETLEKVGALLTRKGAEYGHPIYIIADEPYRELVYDGVEVPFIPTIYANTIVCYSYSKSLSLPGERIGYVCVPDQVEDSQQVFAAMAGAARVLGHVCAPSLQQRVVAACTDLRPDLEAYDRNRNLLYEALTSYGYQCPKPQGAFYMFVKAPGGDSQAFSQRAKEKNLLLVPGDDFGCPEFFRICTCVSYDMIQRSLPVFKELIETQA